MCPSFQATREEQHSTRGRANALRLALTGQLGPLRFADPALRAALDLCLECKACKSECPTNVDMARLKAEFLHQYHRAHRLPLRNRLFGHIARWSHIGGRWGPWANRLTRSPWVRLLNDWCLGIDRRRVPPALARESFETLFQARARSRLQAPARRVLLFPDTFMNYYEPALGLATVDLFEQLGWGVVVAGDDAAPLRCCGRPLISNGLLLEAVEHARQNVNALYAWAEAGQPITACEPSCLLTIQDDYPALLRGEERRRAEVVATACRTWEEVMVDALTQAPQTLAFRTPTDPILAQPHCHQRSLTGVDPSLGLLQRIPGGKVQDLDAGCCGLAGSFGYEKEHYEISRLVGEQRLFPALRAAPTAHIVAAGFSCRLQIQHFTGRRAVHPAELLRSLLADETA